MTVATAPFLDKSSPPTADEYVLAVGPAAARWTRLVDWAREAYGLDGEPNFFGLKSGWALRFRRAGKALFTLIPRADGFSAVVVVGPTVWPATADLELSQTTRAALASAHPYPEGRWAWFDVDDDDGVADVIRLVTLKSPPPRRRAAASAGG